MEITDVRIRKVADEGKMKAIVSITFDEEFVVHDIKIIEGQNGLFIAMPSRKMSEGDFRDVYKRQALSCMGCRYREQIYLLCLPLCLSLIHI